MSRSRIHPQSHRQFADSFRVARRVIEKDQVLFENLENLSKHFGHQEDLKVFSNPRAISVDIINKHEAWDLLLTYSGLSRMSNRFIDNRLAKLPHSNLRNSINISLGDVGLFRLSENETSIGYKIVNKGATLLKNERTVSAVNLSKISGDKIHLPLDYEPFVSLATAEGNKDKIHEVADYIAEQPHPAEVSCYSVSIRDVRLLLPEPVTNS